MLACLFAPAKDWAGRARIIHFPIRSITACNWSLEHSLNFEYSQELEGWCLELFYRFSANCSTIACNAASFCCKSPISAL